MVLQEYVTLDAPGQSCVASGLGLSCDYYYRYGW